MAVVLDGIDNAVYDDEPDEMRPEYRAEVLRDLVEDALRAIHRIDDHGDGITSARKSEARHRVRALESFALTLVGE